MTEIGARTGKDTVISFKNFNPQDEEHLCIFHVARLVHGLNNKNLYINVGIIQEFKFEIQHWKIRNQFKWNHSYKNVDVLEILHSIKNMKEYQQIPFGLASIYEEYYMDKEEVIEEEKNNNND